MKSFDRLRMVLIWTGWILAGLCVLATVSAGAQPQTCEQPRVCPGGAEPCIQVTSSPGATFTCSNLVEIPEDLRATLTDAATSWGRISKSRRARLEALRAWVDANLYRPVEASTGRLEMKLVKDGAIK